MVSVNFKLAILTVLANWPDRRATIDEIRQEVGVIFANGGHADSLRRLSALGDIDIFQNGLVSRNEEGFQITDAGLSLLQSLESPSEPSPEISTASTSQPFRLIDDLIGNEERLKIFDLEFRTLDNVASDENGSDQPGQDARNQVIEAPRSAPSIGGGGSPESVNSKADESDGVGQPARPVEANWLSEIEALGDTSLMDADGVAESVDSETNESDGTGQPTHPDEANWLSEIIEAPGDASLMDANGLPESVDSETYDAGQSVDGDQHVRSDENEPVFVAAPRVASPDVPAFLQPSFGSKGQEPERKSLQLATFLAFIEEKSRFMASAWRCLFSESLSIEKTERFVGSVGGAAFALLSLLVVVTCIGAAIALGQIKSLKSDIAVLHREVFSLKERVAKSEQVEKARRDLEQQEEIKGRSDTQTNKSGGENRSDQTALNLSREEIQLIREYIKPAPSAGAAAPAINVGDPVEGGMIPLPSQLTDKVPKLVGGKFSIRNGAIIIVKRDSRQADAVLAPN
jgi:hypothetical protein